MPEGEARAPKGAVYFSRACMPYMVKAKSGVIVTLGSVTGFECDGNSTTDASLFFRFSAP